MSNSYEQSMYYYEPVSTVPQFTYTGMPEAVAASLQTYIPLPVSYSVPTNWSAEISGALSGENRLPVAAASSAPATYEAPTPQPTPVRDTGPTMGQAGAESVAWTFGGLPGRWGAGVANTAAVAAETARQATQFSMFPELTDYIFSGLRDTARSWGDYMSESWVRPSEQARQTYFNVAEQTYGLPGAAFAGTVQGGADITSMLGSMSLLGTPYAGGSGFLGTLRNAGQAALRMNVIDPYAGTTAPEWLRSLGVKSLAYSTPAVSKMLPGAGAPLADMTLNNLLTQLVYPDPTSNAEFFARATGDIASGARTVGTTKQKALQDWAGIRTDTQGVIPKSDTDLRSRYQLLSLENIMRGRKLGEGSEFEVFEAGVPNRVIKVSEPYHASETARARIEHAILVDRLVGDGTLKLEGYYESGKNKVANPIFSQEMITGRPATSSELEAHMTRKGFKKSRDGEAFIKRENGVEYTVSDLQIDNVIVDKRGNVHIIDADVNKSGLPRGASAGSLTYAPGYGDVVDMSTAKDFLDYALRKSKDAQFQGTVYKYQDLPEAKFKEWDNNISAAAARIVLTNPSLADILLAQDRYPHAGLPQAMEDAQQYRSQNQQLTYQGSLGDTYQKTLAAIFPESIIGFNTDNMILGGFSQEGGNRGLVALGGTPEGFTTPLVALEHEVRHISGGAFTPDAHKGLGSGMVEYVTRPGEMESFFAPGVGKIRDQLYKQENAKQNAEFAKNKTVENIWRPATVSPAQVKERIQVEFDKFAQGKKSVFDSAVPPIIKQFLRALPKENLQDYLRMLVDQGPGWVSTGGYDEAGRYA